MIELIDNYLKEFITVLTITFIVIVTPGPDFIVVVKNSISVSKKSGILTALGVASAVWIHIAYSLFGIALIISKSILLFNLIKYLGVGYLTYLGISCLINKSKESDGVKIGKRELSKIKSFRMGFINNVLNPKATLFFLSLFTQVVDLNTPILIKILYGFIVSITCFIWFSLVSILLNNSKFRSYFIKLQFYIEKVMGSLLIIYAIRIAFYS